MIRVLFASILFFCSSMLLKAQTIEISPVCFNTPENDFGIRKIGDKIYVVSADLKVNVTIKNRKSENDRIYSDLFEVVNCELKDARLLSKEFKQKVSLSSTFHDGPVTGTSDLLFFTNNGGVKNTDKLSIFYLTKKDSLWDNAIEFPLNSDKFNISHPFYDAENKTLYYASDENGNLDLFTVPFNGKEFGTPAPIVSANTDSAECFPYYWKGKLHFTSNRKESLGGYDLFFLENEKVFSMGSPFNSEYDDLSLIHDSDTSGFFSTRRESQGIHDDIYAFTIVPPVKIIDKEAEIVAEIKENTILLKEEFTKLLDLRSEAKKVGVSKDILTLINKAILSYEKGFPESMDNLNLQEIIKVNKEIEGTKALIEQQIAQKTNVEYTNTSLLTQANELLKNSKIENVQFATNSALIEGEFISLLKGTSELVNSNSTWKLTLSGHTDNIGSAEFNLDLSKRRVESVKAFLVNHGVSASRIIIEYYGLTRPIVLNDTEKNRFKNRRVEFKITE
jgi:outer membrane protein OmpA-like peptidoglycan-associated protein